eukprot:853527_1
MSRPDPICRYSKHQITTHCARMISAFPVQFSAKQKPEFWKLHDLVGADEITEFLITLCTQRFDHDELNNSTTGHQKHSRSADAKLIIVDLDAIGTVLPKALSGEIDADEIRTHNQEQLRCNVLSKHKVIYKKGFMDFIEMVHGWKDVYHLASFTQNEPFIDRYKVISIEIYFNWFYCKSMCRRQKNMFKFKFVQQTINKLQQKSINRLNVDSISGLYEKIFIVDCKENKNWLSIPSKWIQATTALTASAKVHPIEIFPLDTGDCTNVDDIAAIDSQKAWPKWIIEWIIDEHEHLRNSSVLAQWIAFDNINQAWKMSYLRGEIFRIPEGNPQCD